MEKDTVPSYKIAHVERFLATSLDSYYSKSSIEGHSSGVSSSHVGREFVPSQDLSGCNLAVILKKEDTDKVGDRILSLETDDGYEDLLFYINKDNIRTGTCTAGTVHQHPVGITEQDPNLVDLYRVRPYNLSLFDKERSTRISEKSTSGSDVSIWVDNTASIKL